MDIGSLNDIAVSPDGKWLAAAVFRYQDNQVRVWNLDDGKEKWKLKGHKYDIFSLAFSPDSKLLASGSKDRTVRLWTLADGKELRQFEGHMRQVLASAGYDRSIRLWDVASGRELLTEGRHAGGVSDAMYTQAGKTITTVNINGTVREWDSATNKVLSRKESPKGTDHIGFCPKNDLIASSLNEQLILWDRKTGKTLFRLVTPNAHVVAAAFSPDGKTLVGGAGNYFFDNAYCNTRQAQ